MKKLICFILILAAVSPVMAQSGRIRISFAGFDCYRETWDDILHADGKGDEVYFNFGFSLADKNGNSKLSYEKRTGVYGDATGPFSNRISAGSFVDLFGNNKGGIKAGDTYRCNTIVGEYDMADGDILTIVPTGWEHDPIADNSASFFFTMKGFYNSINQKLAPIMIGFNVLTGNLGGIIYQAGSLGISKINAGGNQGELGKAGTRPLGMEKYGDFSPKLVVVNTPNLNTICNSDMGFGKGVIGVNYDEVAVGNSRDHGNYTILLRIEFFLNQNATAAALPSSSTGSTGIKKLEVPANTSSIAGTWKGTWGSGTNNSPNFYSFQFNADGSMSLLDAQGNTTATGKYSWANNQLTVTYTYNNNSGTYSAIGSLSNNQLNGTWGAGTNGSGAGKWVMNKASLSATSNIR
jgi:hypothetical protein